MTAKNIHDRRIIVNDDGSKTYPKIGLTETTDKDKIIEQLTNSLAEATKKMDEEALIFQANKRAERRKNKYTARLTGLSGELNQLIVNVQNSEIYNTEQPFGASPYQQIISNLMEAYAWLKIAIDDIDNHDNHFMYDY